MVQQMTQTVCMQLAFTGMYPYGLDHIWIVWYTYMVPNIYKLLYRLSSDFRL